jgi:hypothetical protein
MAASSLSGRPPSADSRGRRVRSEVRSASNIPANRPDFARRSGRRSERPRKSQTRRSLRFSGLRSLKRFSAGRASTRSLARREHARKMVRWDVAAPRARLARRTSAGRHPAPRDPLPPRCPDRPVLTATIAGAASPRAVRRGVGASARPRVREDSPPSRCSKRLTCLRVPARANAVAL